MINSKKFLTTLILLSIVGCSSTPRDLTLISDDELCESFGFAYASNNTKDLSKIITESDKRGITENSLCMMFAEFGMKKYYEKKNAPSGFSTFINTVDSIGSAGHSQNHKVTIN